MITASNPVNRVIARDAGLRVAEVVAVRAALEEVGDVDLFDVEAWALALEIEESAVFPPHPPIPPTQPSAPSGAGALAPGNPVRELWDRGLAITGPDGRSIIGKLRKQYGDIAVLEAIAQCEAESPSDPVPYLIACAKQRGRANGRGSPVTTIYEGAFRAVDAVIERDARRAERDRGDDRQVVVALLDGRGSGRDSAGAA